MGFPETTLESLLFRSLDKFGDIFSWAAMRTWQLQKSFSSSIFDSLMHPPYAFWRPRVQHRVGHRGHQRHMLGTLVPLYSWWIIRIVSSPRSCFLKPKASLCKWHVTWVPGFLNPIYSLSTFLRICFFNKCHVNCLNMRASQRFTHNHPGSLVWNFLFQSTINHPCCLVSIVYFPGFSWVFYDQFCSSATKTKGEYSKNPRGGDPNPMVNHPKNLGFRGLWVTAKHRAQLKLPLASKVKAPQMMQKLLCGIDFLLPF